MAYRDDDWTEDGAGDDDDDPPQGETHSYTCDDCYYRWQVTEPAGAGEATVDDDDDEAGDGDEEDDGLLEPEEPVITKFTDPVCPMCGSHSVSES